MRINFFFFFYFAVYVFQPVNVCGETSPFRTRSYVTIGNMGNGTKEENAIEALS